MDKREKENLFLSLIRGACVFSMVDVLIYEIILTRAMLEVGVGIENDSGDILELLPASIKS